MANSRYNCKVQSGLIAGRKAYFYFYAQSDSDALAVVDLIDAELENGAKCQVSKVIREAATVDPAAGSALEPKYKSFSFQNNSDLSKKRLSFTILGLKKTSDTDALATAIAALGVAGTGLCNQTGDDMTGVVSSDGGINLFAGGTPKKDLSASN